MPWPGWFRAWASNSMTKSFYRSLYRTSFPPIVNYYLNNPGVPPTNKPDLIISFVISDYENESFRLVGIWSCFYLSPTSGFDSSLESLALSPPWGTPTRSHREKGCTEGRVGLRSFWLASAFLFSKHSLLVESLSWNEEFFTANKASDTSISVASALRFWLAGD